MTTHGVDPGVQRLWRELEDKQQAIVKERHRLQRIWKQIKAMHKANTEARAEFEKKAAFDFLPPEERVMLNIGGHVFETTAGILCRDRCSMLAAICRSRPPVPKDKDRAFFLDRDWWIFRYILHFLKKGDLPEDQALLREMYEEAAIYRLNTLRRAIERRLLPLLHSKGHAKHVARADRTVFASTRTSSCSNCDSSAAANLAFATNERLPYGRGSGADPSIKTRQRLLAELEQGAGEPLLTPSASLFKAPLPDPYGLAGHSSRAS